MQNQQLIDEIYVLVREKIPSLKFKKRTGNNIYSEDYWNEKYPIHLEHLLEAMGENYAVDGEGVIWFWNGDEWMNEPIGGIFDTLPTLCLSDWTKSSEPTLEFIKSILKSQFNYERNKTNSKSNSIPPKLFSKYL